MFIFEQVEVDDEEFVFFEHDDLNWAIDIENFNIYHFETGWECLEEFKGSKYRTVMKRFKAWWSEKGDKERIRKTKQIKRGPIANVKK